MGVKKTADKIEQMTPFHGPTMERYILLLNDNAGIFAQSILRPSDQPNQIMIVLKIFPKDSNGGLSYNN